MVVHGGTSSRRSSRRSSSSRSNSSMGPEFNQHHSLEIVGKAWWCLILRSGPGPSASSENGLGVL